MRDADDIHVSDRRVVEEVDAAEGLASGSTIPPSPPLHEDQLEHQN